MTGRAQTHGEPAANAIVAPVDTVDHVHGDPLGPVIVEYGDYECPYARVAFREIERVQRRTGHAVRFVFRHFPLTELHPHALAAAAAAEAAALQDQFWSLHALLFHRQNALANDYLRRYAAKLGLDVVRFYRDRTGPAMLEVLAPRLQAGSGEP
jgi:protein-disulfide isomerase